MALGVNGSQALLNAIAALAALQITPLQRNHDKGRERAQRYYLAALKDHHVFDTPGKYTLNDAMIATSMLLAHYEVHSIEKFILRISCGMENFPRWRCMSDTRNKLFGSGAERPRERLWVVRYLLHILEWI